MTNEFGEVVCEVCGESVPEDMIQGEDENICEECYIQRGIDRAEAKYDLD